MWLLLDHHFPLHTFYKSLGGCRRLVASAEIFWDRRGPRLFLWKLNEHLEILICVRIDRWVRESRDGRVLRPCICIFIDGLNAFLWFINYLFHKWPSSVRQAVASRGVLALFQVLFTHFSEFLLVLGHLLVFWDDMSNSLSPLGVCLSIFGYAKSRRIFLCFHMTCCKSGIWRKLFPVANLLFFFNRVLGFDSLLVICATIGFEHLQIFVFLNIHLQWWIGVEVFNADLVIDWPIVNLCHWRSVLSKIFYFHWIVYRILNTVFNLDGFFHDCFMSEGFQLCVFYLCLMIEGLFRCV